MYEGLEVLEQDWVFKPIGKRNAFCALGISGFGLFSTRGCGLEERLLARYGGIPIVVFWAFIYFINPVQAVPELYGGGRGG